MTPNFLVSITITQGPCYRLGVSIESQEQGFDQPADIAEDRNTVYERRKQSENVQGVYIISVAARVLEMHPQTLRKYERIGLVSPSRTVGMLRLYSEEDIARLRLIKHLVGNLGLNLAGVELALILFNRLISLRTRMNRLEGEALKASLEQSIEEMLEILQGKLR